VHVNEYLDLYFDSADAFAMRCSIDVQRLDQLISLELAPAPSYVVNDQTLRSMVFGAMQAPGATSGRYFHPKSASWVARAGLHADTHCLRRTFDESMTSALQTLHVLQWPLVDSFDASGNVLHSGLQTRLDNYWRHLLGGTFGLCVADPSSETSIARKEVLQEQLVSVTQNGQRREFSAMEARTVLTMIDQYAESAMPFSPIEYHLSSRKRLVHDLRPIVVAAASVNG
jgi:hypothetical protein